MSFLANNILFQFSFNIDIDYQRFPRTIIVVLETLVENDYLNNHLSIETNVSFTKIRSKPLVCTFDQSKCRAFDGTHTVAAFSLLGITDFGVSVERISVWQEGFDLSCLSHIQLTDDIREWNEEYHPYCSTDEYSEPFASKIHSY